MQTRTSAALGAVAISASLALLLTGCGAGDSPSAGDADAAVTYMTPDGECAVAPIDGVDFAAANELITAYQQPTTGLFDDEPLPQPVDEGTVVAFLNNDTPVGTLMYGFLEGAAAAAGVTLVNVSTGTDAQSINTALNSVLELDPDIVVAEAIDATFWQDQLDQLRANGVAIVYGSQGNAEEFGLDDTLGGLNASLQNGRVLAAGAINFTCGTATEFVFYNMPEVLFSQQQLDGATEYLAETCPQCTLRSVDISVTNPSPADAIVSDLQAHPETEYFITPADQFQVGLADKADLAGITNAQGFGQTSLPPNIQALIDGRQNAGFAIDVNFYMWLQLDEGLRKAQGVWEPYTDWLTVTKVVGRVLTPATATDYPDGLFVAYPDMEPDFTALWGR